MLRSNAVGPLQSLLTGGGNQRCAILLERFRGYWIVHGFRSDFLHHTLSQLFDCSNKDRDSFRIVFRLGDQIASNEARLTLVAHNDCFRRPAEKLNRALKSDLLLHSTTVK